MNRTTSIGAGRLATVAALTVAVLAISSSAVLVRWADASPVALAFWRTAGGAVLLAPAARRAGRWPPGTNRGLIVVAGLALAAHFATWLASLELTSVAASVTLVSTTPIMVALILTARSRILGTSSRSIGATTWFAVAAAVVGAGVIALGDAGGGADSGAGDAPLLGDGLALIGALTMAIYLIAGDKLRRDLSTAAYAARAYGVAAVALLALSIVVGIPLTGYDGRTWAAIAAMILGPQLAGHTMLNLLLKRLGSVSVSLALLAEPIGASLLAWALLSQAPPAAVWFGGPIVLFAVASQILNSRESVKEATAPAD